MRKLLIHIGSHKTGSTSIQHHLARNVEALRRHNLSLFYENSRTGELLLPDLHSWIGFIEPQRVVPHGMYVREPERLAERLGQLEGDIILSSENFSFFFDPRHIDALRDAMARVFGEIRIVCYLRRQDRQAISHHQEGAKPYRSAEYDLFGHSTNALPDPDPKHDLYLDYHQRLSMWAAAFGDAALMLRVYDRKALPDGDVVQDFFQLIGVDDYQRVGDRNTSLGFREAKLGHLVQRSDFQHKPALSSLVHGAGREDRKLLPARAAARAYYERYVPSNVALNARFRVSPHERLFSEDFDDYPEDADDRWSEETANESMTFLLRLLDESLSDLSADDLRDAALAVHATKPATAVRLLRAAHRLRPEGKFIKRKLAEFEKLLGQ